MELEESAVINEIKTIFQSENESAIHDAIAYIHEKGSIKTLPLLFDLLVFTDNKNIKNDIYNCLADTKDKSATTIFIETLHDSRFVNEKARLLSVMWQSNLDFSKYSNDFIHLLLKENYETAIEAYTIIEMCVPNFTEEEKINYRKTISEALAHEKSEKCALLRATLDILQ